MKKRIISAEIILVLASVFIFRSLWMLLDKMPVMHNDFVLLFSFITAIIITIISYHYIISRKNK